MLRQGVSGACEKLDLQDSYRCRIFRWTMFDMIVQHACLVLGFCSSKPATRILQAEGSTQSPSDPATSHNQNEDTGSSTTKIRLHGLAVRPPSRG